MTGSLKACRPRSFNIIRGCSVTRMRNFRSRMPLLNRSKGSHLMLTPIQSLKCLRRSSSNRIQHKSKKNSWRFPVNCSCKFSKRRMQLSHLSLQLPLSNKRFRLFKLIWARSLHSIRHNHSLSINLEVLKVLSRRKIELFSCSCRNYLMRKLHPLRKLLTQATKHSSSLFR